MRFGQTDNSERETKRNHEQYQTSRHSNSNGFWMAAHAVSNSKRPAHSM